MNLFIDTSIFINYLQGDYPDKVFLKLKEIILKGKVKLLLTEQVLDEYNRKFTYIKNEKIEQMSAPILNSEKDNFNDEPVNINNFSKFKNKLVSLIEKSENKIKKQKERIKNEKRELAKREKEINSIFSKSSVVKCDANILKLAETRYLKGNPPRKTKERNASYGDAINWELILKYSDKKNPLVIIADDGDYADNLYGETIINQFLKKDWKSVSRRKISFFTEPGTFINYFEGKEFIKKESIEEVKRKQEIENYTAQEQRALILLSEYAGDIVKKLHPLEKKILEMRYGLIDGVPHSLEEIAQEFGVSSKEISFIESRALRRIRNLSVHSTL